uniref:Core protein n=1 Tax=Slender scalyhead hepatitis B virus TaxID=3138874 RepID=A0AAU7LK91_HBV
MRTWIMSAPDPFLEFGLDQRLINLLPLDYFPALLSLVTLLEALLGDQIDSAVHHSLHHTALRQILGCYYSHVKFQTWLNTNLNQEAQALVRGEMLGEINRLQQLLWYHWASLTFGDNAVKDFVISFATWIQTPAAYRPPNAPLLSRMSGGSHVPQTRRGRSPSPRRRSASPKHRSGSRGSNR